MTTDLRAPDDRPVVDLGSYRRAITRRWFVPVVLTVIGAVLGFYLGAQRAETFQSTAIIEVNQGLVSITASAGGDAPNMATEVQVARSTVVTTAAAEELGGSYTGVEFQRRATATSPPDASTLALTFQAPTPDEAQLGATAWADAYLANRRADFEGAVTRARQQVEARVIPLEAAYAVALDAAVAAEPGTPADDRAEAELDSVSNQLSGARVELDSLSSIVIDPGRVISTPVRPEQSQGLPALVYLLAGGLTGLLLGAGLAIAVEQRFGRVRRARDVRALLGIPVWSLGDATRSPGVFEPAIEAVAARIPDTWRTLTVTDLGTGMSNDVAAELVEVLRANNVEVELGPGRAIAHQVLPVLRVVSAPAASGPEAAAAMSRSDGVVVVVEAKTRVADLRAARNAVEESGTAMLAALLATSGPQSWWRAGVATSTVDSGRTQPHPAMPPGQPNPPFGDGATANRPAASGPPAVAQRPHP